MSKILNYSSETLLNNGVKVICNLNIPVIGNEKDEIYDMRMDSSKPMLTSQYLNAVKNVLKHYEMSPLPRRFIEGQEILITQFPKYEGLYGIFDLVRDIILVDADTILGARKNECSSFLFGHQMGHKIAKYRATSELYKSIADILGISLDGNFPILNETYADECGNMVSPIINEHGILPVPLSENKREGIQKVILRNIYN